VNGRARGKRAGQKCGEGKRFHDAIIPRQDEKASDGAN
jgi:hypothetical protein